MSKKNIEKLLSNFKNPIDYEFIDLYPLAQSITENDRVFLKRILVKKGFKVTDWSRGNWSLGPRFLSLTLKKGNCRCIVNKLYYSEYKGQLYKYKYRVTEQVNCNKIK